MAFLLNLFFQQYHLLNNFSYFGYGNSDGLNYEIEYLINKNWDMDSLSDEDFEIKSHEYVDNYRNEAAHPNVLKIEVADKCKEKTKKIIKKYMQCKN